MSELGRILSLPVSKPMTDKEHAALSRELIQAKPFEGGCSCEVTCHGRPLRLLPDQAAGVAAFRKTGRGFWNIDVGGGKSALSWLVAAELFKRKPNSRIVLCVPPSLVRQWTTRDVQWCRTHLNAWIPRVVNFHKQPARMQLALARNGGPGIYVAPYSMFSLPHAAAVLELLDAALVILDEAHAISTAGTDTGKSRSFWRWVKANDPAGVAMSGSFEKSTPADYYQLQRWILAEKSPMPIKVMEAQRWSAMLHSKAGVDRPIPKDELLYIRPLVRWSYRQDPSAFSDLKEDPRTIRTAFRVRLQSAPGVIVSRGLQLIGCSLEIANRELRPNSALQGLIDQLNDRWTSPEGVVFAYAVQTHNTHRELNAGFYLKHEWPKHPKTEEAKRALEARSIYWGFLRNFLKRGASTRMKLDTPTAVGNYMHRRGAPAGEQDLYDAWRGWKALVKPDHPKPFATLVPVDDFKVRAAVEWAKRKKKKAIIWIDHVELGDWIYRELVKAGVKAMRKAAGDSWLRHDGSENFVCVASIRSHGEGKNLQAFEHQLMVQWCRTAPRMQQLLGRTFRHGQRANRLVVDTLVSTEHEHQSVQATLYDTTFSQQIRGGPRRLLLLADWDPLPKQYPPDFLREQGFQLAQNGARDESEESDE